MNENLYSQLEEISKEFHYIFNLDNKYFQVEFEKDCFASNGVIGRFKGNLPVPEVNIRIFTRKLKPEGDTLYIQLNIGDLVNLTYSGEELHNLVSTMKRDIESLTKFLVLLNKLEAEFSPNQVRVGYQTDYQTELTREQRMHWLKTRKYSKDKPNDKSI